MFRPAGLDNHRICSFKSDNHTTNIDTGTEVVARRFILQILC